MKKLVCILILFCFVSPVFAEIQAPQWSEFAPAQYVNAEIQQDNTMPVWLNHLLYYTIIGIPISNMDTRKYNKIKINNYWTIRRKEFKESITQCQNTTNENELMYRYLVIRQNELSKNQNRELEKIKQNQEDISNQIQRVYNHNIWNH